MLIKPLASYFILYKCTFSVLGIIVHFLLIFGRFKLKGPVHFARGYVNPPVFDVPVHLEVCECHIDAKIFYPEAFFIKKS